MRSVPSRPYEQCGMLLNNAMTPTGCWQYILSVDYMLSIPTWVMCRIEWIDPFHPTPPLFVFSMNLPAHDIIPYAHHNPNTNISYCSKFLYDCHFLFNNSTDLLPWWHILTRSTKFVCVWVLLIHSRWYICFLWDFLSINLIASHSTAATNNLDGNMFSFYIILRLYLYSCRFTENRIAHLDYLFFFPCFSSFSLRQTQMKWFASTALIF